MTHWSRRAHRGVALLYHLVELDREPRWDAAGRVLLRPALWRARCGYRFEGPTDDLDILAAPHGIARDRRVVCGRCLAWALVDALDPDALRWMHGEGPHPVFGVWPRTPLTAVARGA